MGSGETRDSRSLEGETVLEWADNNDYDWKSAILRKHEAETGVEPQ
jgi:hypothetical protein